MLIRVRGAPGSHRDAVVGLHGDSLKIAVRAPAERGRANKAIARVLARALGVPPGQVELCRGRTHKEKQFRIHGAKLDQVKDRLARILAN